MKNEDGVRSRQGSDSGADCSKSLNEEASPSTSAPVPPDRFSPAHGEAPAPHMMGEAHSLRSRCPGELIPVAASEDADTVLAVFGAGEGAFVQVICSPISNAEMYEQYQYVLASIQALEE